MTKSRVKCITVITVRGKQMPRGAHSPSSISCRALSILVASVVLPALLSLSAGCGGKGGSGGSMKYVDAHVHLRANSPAGYGEAASSALTSMDELGIVESLILPPPRPAGAYAADDYKPLAAVANAHTGRFGFLAGGASLNPIIQKAAAAGQVTEADRQQFTANAEAVAASGAVGYGEMTAEHFSLGPDHPYESAPPDNPLFLLLSDIAAEKHMPIDIHMEAVPSDSFPFPLDQYTSRGVGNPGTLKGNIEPFKLLLAHNRNTKIIWDHIGWDHTGYRTPEATRQILSENPNLYMSIKYHPDSPEQNRIMQDGVIKPEWLKVFKEYPDRFVFGSDMFYRPPGAPATGPGGPEGPRTILDQLPANLARKFAYENANSIFGLKVTASDAKLK